MDDRIAHLQTALADRYTIERELGAGGMATVYLTTDIKHNRPVAVKVLRPEIAGALDFTHQHGVAHRDIKPENIVLSAGHALVADGGIARAASAAGGVVEAVGVTDT